MTGVIRPHHTWLGPLISLLICACAPESNEEPQPLPPPQLITQVSGTQVRLQAVSAASDQIVWASGVSATVARTLDGGNTWRTLIVPGPPDLQFRDIHAVSADTAFILSSGSGDASRIYRTTDGGVSWTLQFMNNEPDAFFDCFDFWDSSNGLAYSDAVNEEMVVIRTMDGERWHRLAANTLPTPRGSEGGFAASGTCLITGGDRHAWIGTGAGDTARVLHTPDRGASWQTAELPIISGTATSGVFSLVFFDESNGMALGGSLADTAGFTDNVAVTTNGGRTWSLVGRPTFTGAVYGAAAVPEQPQPTVVAVGPKGLSFTSDGGMTWSHLDSLSHWAVTFATRETGWAVGPDGRITMLTWATQQATSPSE